MTSAPCSRLVIRDESNFDCALRNASRQPADLGAAGTAVCVWSSATRWVRLYPSGADAGAVGTGTELDGASGDNDVDVRGRFQVVFGISSRHKLSLT